jgi:glycosyltransferase involved in cell wall biosynthesis
LNKKPRILYLITEDWYFCSHRLSLAKTARDAGFEVCVATRVDKHRQQIINENFKLFPIKLARENRNPLRELAALFEIIKIFIKEQPDIVHNVSIKPVLYGTWAARLFGSSAVVNLLPGLFWILSSLKSKSRIIEKVFQTMFRFIFLGHFSYTIFQNPDDMDAFLSHKIIPKENAELIRGSGVDVNEFKYTSEPNEVPIIVLPSRMLWEKGIAEFIDAAKSLHQEGIQCRMVLVGAPDPQSHQSVPVETLEQFQAEGEVEWWGYQSDMAKIFAQSNIACLPSYREGAPKALIEAAACGRACVATDVPGCREVVRDGENGLLIPPRDSAAIAKAIRYLILNPAERMKMGERGRQIVINEFSEEIVCGKTLAIYKRLLKQKKPDLSLVPTAHKS